MVATARQICTVKHLFFSRKNVLFLQYTIAICIGMSIYANKHTHKYNPDSIHFTRKNMEIVLNNK